MEVTEGQQGEINTTEDILLHFFKRRGHTMPHMATWEDVKFWSGWSRGKSQTGAFIGIFVVEARQRRGNSIGLAGLNNIGGLQAVGVVFSCLIPGPRLTQGSGNSGLIGVSQIKGTVVDIDLGLVGLYVKGILLKSSSLSFYFLFLHIHLSLFNSQSFLC